MSPEAFVRLLAQELQASGVVVGQNYRFGYKAKGDTAMLQQLGSELGLQVHVLDLLEAGPLAVDGQVSSSKIREALASGRLRTVAQSLGRPYRLMARVPPEAKLFYLDGSCRYDESSL